MMYIWIAVGVLSFGCMALSDHLCVEKKVPWAGALFPAGCMILAAATVGMLWISDFSEFGVWKIGMLCLSLVMLGLLVHSVVFALRQGGSDALPPEPGQKQPLVSEGVYALCRHPGVLWLGGVYGFAWLAFGTWQWLAAAVLLTGADGLYAYWQDRVIFPRSIENYAAYQNQTPFLLPTRDSIRRCLGRE